MVIRPKFYIVLAILVVIFLPPFAKYQELKYKNRKLSEDLRRLNRDTKQLAVQKKRLETDIGYIEKTAREKIGVARKGEIVLKETPSKK